MASLVVGAPSPSLVGKQIKRRNCVRSHTSISGLAGSTAAAAAAGVPSSISLTGVNKRLLQNGENAVLDVDRRVHARHFHTGTHRNADVTTTRTEPTQRCFIHALYAQALAIVFSFTHLREVATLVSVCSRWRNAALLPPFKNRILYGGADTVLACMRSPLRRHIATVDCTVVGSTWLHKARVSMAHLTSLSLSILAPTISASFAFPPQLTSLRVTVCGHSIAAISWTMQALHPLCQLATCEILAEPPCMMENADFSSLRALSKLTNLAISKEEDMDNRLGGSFLLSSSQCDDILALPHLTRFICSIATDLPHLVARHRHSNTSSSSSPPAWNDIGTIPKMTDVLAQMLPSLPHLMRLSILKWRPSDFVLLSSLPWTHLRDLTITLSSTDVLLDVYTTAFQACTRLSSLRLTIAEHVSLITGDAIHSFVALMCNLRTLQIFDFAGYVHTLSFLDAHLDTLEGLTLWLNGEVPMPQLATLHSMKRLKTLAMRMIDMPAEMHEFLRLIYAPPSRLIPSLEFAEVW